MKERTFTLSKEKTRFICDTPKEQARLARAIGFKQARFSHYLNGVRNITESNLMALATLTNKRPSDFLDDPAEKILADQNFSLDKANTVGIS